MTKLEFTAVEAAICADSAYGDTVDPANTRMKSEGLNNIEAIEKAPEQFTKNGMGATLFKKTENGKSIYMVAEEGTTTTTVSGFSKDFNENIAIYLKNIPDHADDIGEYTAYARKKYGIEDPIWGCGHSQAGPAIAIHGMRNPARQNINTIWNSWRALT